jgi:hypothetical protein
MGSSSLDEIRSSSYGVVNTVYGSRGERLPDPAPQAKPRIRPAGSQTSEAEE